MNRTFYVTPRPNCQENKNTKNVFVAGYSYPVLEITVPEVGGNIRLVIAGNDGQILHKRTNEVAVVGFEPKPFGEFNDIVFQPDVIEDTTEDESTVEKQVVKPAIGKKK
jgi:hypothetical protein